MDHATGIVVGETAVIGDNCTILHAVTLGGTGKERGDRHPKIGHACVLWVLVRRSSATSRSATARRSARRPS